MPISSLDVVESIQPRRRITGMSAVLLPFESKGVVDWPAFEAHIARTADAGLIPAVNMDTGYVNLLDEGTRREVLDRSKAVVDGGPLVAGAYVGDDPGDRFNLDGYRRAIDQVQAAGATPVIFQSFGLTGQADDEIVESYRKLAEHCDRFIGFELSDVFAPFGRIYSPSVYRGLLEIPRCTGAKHSSLDRGLEWERLVWRDELRPDFMVLTGNDLAIDMVMYGSDYLLGLSTFAPDLFARRDRWWESGDSRFFELNDVLQYLGFFSFRKPVPAYKHSAAMFLHLRGWIHSDLTHPASAQRPPADREVLAEIADRVKALVPVRAAP